MRYQVKEFSILCMRRHKPLGSLNSLLSYAPQVSGANPVLYSALQLPDDDNLGPGSRVRNGVQKASGNPVAEWEQARAV